MAVVVVGFWPKLLKPPMDEEKLVDGTVLVVPNPLNKLGAEVVVVVPNPLNPPNPNDVVAVVVPNILKPVEEAGVLPNVEGVPNPVVVDAEVVPKDDPVPKPLVAGVPNAEVVPNPIFGILKPVAAGVPNPVPVPNPVVCVDGVPKRLEVEVVGVLNPKGGVPNPFIRINLKLKKTNFYDSCDWEEYDKNMNIQCEVN